MKKELNPPTPYEYARYGMEIHDMVELEYVSGPCRADPADPAGGALQVVLE